MPVASVSLEPQRFPLKSLEDGFVELVPLSFGKIQRRREIAAESAIKEVENQDGKSTPEMAITMAQHAAAVYEFKHCIVDHNLEELKPKKNSSDPDEEERIVPFDFKKDPGAIDRLNPKIGEEISILIDQLNQFESSEPDGSGN